MFIILLLSIFFIIFSSSWFLIWLGLEMNTLSFLLMSKDVCFKKTEFEFKYFYIQFIGSSLFLASWVYMNQSILFQALMVKLLLFPFLFWVFNLLKWMNIRSMWVLLFLQKIGPICILMNLKINLTNSGKIFLLFNLLISAMLGFMKSNLIDLLTLSSVSHVVLILYLSFYSLFFLIFMLLYFFIVGLMWLYNKTFFHQNFMINFSIIMGMPPSFLFMSKVYMFSYFVSNLIFSLSILMLIVTGLTFLYMKIFLNLFNKLNYKFMFYAHFSSRVLLFYLILGFIFI
uniref:NADH-ubiquinone oxidoreductase chain 2 n=1 Tax=Liposcelis nr. bostrychophila AZ TaxID=1643344 RepID=A0A0F6RAN4_9NEOP|nr:NADH dehydrogenase subunit 2 [Liposcelis nr. bostrychophila AZ]